MGAWHDGRASKENARPLLVALPDDLEVRHHPRRMMLEDVAVIHPLARAVIRHERDSHTTLRWHVDRILPRPERRWLAVHVHDLEEEAVQVERVIHHRVVDDVPHLQLPDLHRRVTMMRLLVDDEVDPVTKTRLESKVHLARWRCRA